MGLSVDELVVGLGSSIKAGGFLANSEIIYQHAIIFQC